MSDRFGIDQLFPGLDKPLGQVTLTVGCVPSERGVPPEVRLCACPCGRPFVTTLPSRRYLAPSHRPRKGAHYTAGERRARKVLQANPPNGQPCPRCNQPMTRQQWAEGKLDTGHVIDRVLQGADLGLRWEHAKCGRAAGATLGNSLRAGNRRSRNW